MTGKQKLLKRQKLRNNEYYDMQSVFDELYKNSLHRLIHATQKDTISATLQTVQLTKQQLDKLNKLRKLAGTEVITFEQQNACC